MTTQEQQMIQSLAERINSTPLAEKDPDAEQFLQQALGRNPDALYILAQTTLVQQYALDQAQKQLADARVQLEQQRQLAPQPRHASSFLGNLLGVHDQPVPPPPPVRQPPQYTPVPDYSQPSYGTPPPPYAQTQYGQPQFGQAPYGQPQSGGFLRGAMQTAAGVAAGAIAFEGIESLMHGFGGSTGSGFGIGDDRPEEIVNNYSGDASPAEHRELSSDIEDRRNDPTAFGDAVDRDDHNDGRDDLIDPAGADNTETSTFDDNPGADDFTSDDSSGGDDFSSDPGDSGF